MRSSGPTEPAPMAANTLAERCAQSLLAADSASRALGMELVEVAPGMARVHMTVAPAMLKGHGIYHGGYLFTLADSAFAFASNTYGQVTVAAGADVTFLQTAHEGDLLEAVATERARQGRSGIYDVSIRRVANALRRRVPGRVRGRSRSLGRALALDPLGGDGNGRSLS
ncbi:MAG: hydroxyphenylacetyl-CoA thioesterase PaaI [Candidatus Dormibacteria bacterium]